MTQKLIRHIPVLERRDNHEAKLPPDLFNYLNQAKELGEQKGRECANITHPDSKYVTQLVRELKFLWSLGFDNPLAEQLLRCVFFYHASRSVLDHQSVNKGTNLGHLLGSLAQTSMVQAFALSHARYHSTLFSLGGELGVKAERWRCFAVGALAVALVAKSIINLGGEAHLPNPVVDTQNKIDLIAYLPEQQLGLCLQIKATHSEQGVKFASEYLRLFYRGVENFNRHHQVDFQPIILDLTLRGPNHDPTYRPKELIREIKTAIQAHI